jgi:putative hemolysin
MYELAVLFALILTGGILAGAEMAVVTVRRARLEQAAEGGSRRARLALHLRSNPERFLATVQVGITLIGAVAGAFGGASFAARLEPLLRDLGCGDAAPEIAFAIVVAIVTFLSVVFGELVPKSLALRHAEHYALWVARPMLWLGWLARPVISLLTATSNAVLRLFADRTNFVEAKLTRDDLERMVEEATTAGDLDVRTGQLMTRALDFLSLRVDDVMVPRRQIVALPRDADAAAIRRALLDAGHRRVPVYDGSIDNIVGYLLREDVLVCLWDGRPIAIDELRREPFFVPQQLPAELALRELQQRRLHLAIVVEEHGGTAGLVTLEDLIEELVGEIFHERDAPQPKQVAQEAPGTFRLLGGAPLREVQRDLGLELPAPDDARTVSGLLVVLAGGRVPSAGERFTAPPDLEFEVVEASPRRVRSARLHTRVAMRTPGAAAAAPADRPS